MTPDTCIHYTNVHTNAHIHPHSLHSRCVVLNTHDLHDAVNAVRSHDTCSAFFFNNRAQNRAWPGAWGRTTSGGRVGGHSREALCGGRQSSCERLLQPRCLLPARLFVLLRGPEVGILVRAQREVQALHAQAAAWNTHTHAGTCTSACTCTHRYMLHAHAHAHAHAQAQPIQGRSLVCQQHMSTFRSLSTQPYYTHSVAVAVAVAVAAAEAVAVTVVVAVAAAAVAVVAAAAVAAAIVAAAVAAVAVAVAVAVADVAYTPFAAPHLLAAAPRLREIVLLLRGGEAGGEKGAEGEVVLILRGGAGGEEGAEGEVVLMLRGGAGGQRVK